jgi:hypothetical protein
MEERIMRKRSYLVSTCAVLLVVGIAAWCMPAPIRAIAVSPLENDLAVEVAEDATDALLSSLFAAVLEITDATTPENVAPNSLAISLLLPECQKGYRLLDGTGEPLDPRNVPNGDFERDALEDALAGQTTQIVAQGKLLTVVPLPFADANCALCHTNYFDFEPGEIVGAVSLQLPLFGSD